MNLFVSVVRPTRRAKWNMSARPIKEATTAARNSGTMLVLIFTTHKPFEKISLAICTPLLTLLEECE
jgi:hypothetical protein